jgi:hypothetical protein
MARISIDLVARHPIHLLLSLLQALNMQRLSATHEKTEARHTK